MRKAPRSMSQLLPTSRRGLRQVVRIFKEDAWVTAVSTALPPTIIAQIKNRLHLCGAMTSAARWSMSVSSQVGQFSLSHAVGDTACKLPASLTWTGYDCATSCRCSTDYPHRKPDESLAASLRPGLEVGKVPEGRPIIHCVATTRQRCLLRRHQRQDATYPMPRTTRAASCMWVGTL